VKRCFSLQYFFFDAPFLKYKCRNGSINCLNLILVFDETFEWENKYFSSLQF
jgi:hypothetical protein